MRGVERVGERVGPGGVGAVEPEGLGGGVGDPLVAVAGSRAGGRCARGGGRRRPGAPRGRRAWRRAWRRCRGPRRSGGAGACAAPLAIGLIGTGSGRVNVEHVRAGRAQRADHARRAGSITVADAAVAPQHVVEARRARSRGRAAARARRRVARRAPGARACRARRGSRRAGPARPARAARRAGPPSRGTTRPGSGPSAPRSCCRRGPRSAGTSRRSTLAFTPCGDHAAHPPGPRRGGDAGPGAGRCRRCRKIRIRALRDAVRGPVLRARRLRLQRRAGGVQHPLGRRQAARRGARSRDTATCAPWCKWADRYDVPLVEPLRRPRLQRQLDEQHRGRGRPRRARTASATPTGSRRSGPARGSATCTRGWPRQRRDDPRRLVPDGRARRARARRRDGARGPRDGPHARPRAQLRRRHRRRRAPQASTTASCSGRCAAAAGASGSSPRSGCAPARSAPPRTSRISYGDRDEALAALGRLRAHRAGRAHLDPQPDEQRRDRSFGQYLGSEARPAAASSGRSAAHPPPAARRTSPSSAAGRATRRGRSTFAASSLYVTKRLSAERPPRVPRRRRHRRRPAPRRLRRRDQPAPAATPPRSRTATPASASRSSPTRTSRPPATRVKRAPPADRPVRQRRLRQLRRPRPRPTPSAATTARTSSGCAGSSARYDPANRFRPTQGIR